MAPIDSNFTIKAEQSLSQDSSQANAADSWLDKARREWEVFGVSTGDGLIKHGISNYVEHPENIARDGLIMGGLTLATKGPAWMRMPAYLVGAIGAGLFLGEAAPKLAEVGPRFSETAVNPASLAENKKWASEQLGPLGFEVATMAVTGGALYAGGRVARSLRTNFAADTRAAGTPAADTRTIANTAERKSEGQPDPAAEVQRISAQIDVSKPAQHMSESERVRAVVAQETDFEVMGRMERGTHGAWLVRSNDGTKHIFKLVSRDDVTSQIRRSALSAEAVNTTMIRTPQYERVGFTEPHGSWYVQEFLPGDPAPNPNAALVNQLMKLNDKQAGKALNNDNNWSNRIMSELQNDSSGWQRNIANSGPEGKALVAAVRSMTEQQGSFVPRNNDIVHGDFQHYNALVNPQGKAAGYVDWEGAGNGDRAIDLSRLLYDVYAAKPEIGYLAHPLTKTMLRKNIEQISGTEALNNYMSYWILQVADYGVRRGGEFPSMFNRVGRNILDDLQQAQQIGRKAA